MVADGIVYIGSTDGNLYAFSVNGVFPASRLPGGELGVKPAISSLKPDYSLRAVTQLVLAAIPGPVFSGGRPFRLRWSIIGGGQSWS